MDFQSTYGETAHTVLRVRKIDVARIERIEDWKAEQRKERESAAFSAASRLIPRRIDLSQLTDHSAGRPRDGPDFVNMWRQGLIVLDEGLPPSPEAMTHSDAVPVSYWTTNMCGAVQFVFFIERDGDGFRPADITLEYDRDGDAWYPVRMPLFFGGGYEGDIGSANFMRHQSNQAIEISHTRYQDEAEPGTLAIVMSGRHSPDVEEIWLVQGDRPEKRPASGHFGSWTICTETFAPLRVEAHDGTGLLLGSVEGP